MSPLKSRIAPGDVHQTLSRHMLVDGFPFVLDLEKSNGTYLSAAATGKEYLDFFMFFASCPLGHNHPGLLEVNLYRRLASVAASKPSNSDLYTVEMAEFVETFARIPDPECLSNLFFISGGALAVENALKAAFDWKVRKNFAKGLREEKGHKVIHFRQAFHGRTGYTMSLTNTDPVKTDYYPKFKWPRIENPKITFPLEDHLKEVRAVEKRAVKAIEDALTSDGGDIAAIIRLAKIKHKQLEPQRVSTMGFGEYRPIQPNELADGRQKNRRVEIILGTMASVLNNDT